VNALLDRNADVPLPAGYIVVATEIDFLRYVDGSKSLLVRGADLCNWAETFYRARSIPYTEIYSPLRELTAACPSLTGEQAKEIYNLLGDHYDQLPKPASVLNILQILYPQRMWLEYASLEHGATWLNWLVTQSLPEALLPILVVTATQWREQASGPEYILYTATKSDEAMEVLLAWLGVNDSKEYEKLDEFPGEIPTNVIEKVKLMWKHEIISTHGQTIKILLAKRTPQKLKLLVTELSTDYFKKYPQDLNHDLFGALAAYLNRNQQRDLSCFIPPSVPKQIPHEPAEVQQWYRTSYLPFRSWQEQYGNDVAHLNVQKSAHEFSLWYLEQYAKGLLGGPLTPYISFNRSSQLATKRDGYITLMVVLDGLHVSDAQYVLQALQKVTSRLTLTQDDLIFAPLPTITEFCKDALFKGTTPLNAIAYHPLGDILPESRSPVDSLQNAKPGQLYLWRVQEPDSTYHSHNKSQTLQRDIESQLDGIANKIADVVNTVVQDIPLRIVITTDHGRLLAKSQRSLPVPTGMGPHGRAAWGNSERIFPASGYIIEEEIVYLHKERFALPSDVAISYTEKAFHTKDGRTGTELYAHGGLYPEEVIIPWLTFVRDLEAPDIIVSLSGKGRAKIAGQIQLRVQNLSEVQVRLVEIIITSTSGPVTNIHTDLDCPSTYESKFSLVLDIWPTQKEIQTMTCQIEFQLPGGREFKVTADIVMESEEMYTKDQNILEGLE